MMKTDDIKIKQNWRKSKDEIWNEVFSNIDDVKTIPKIKRLSFWKYTVAAIIAMIVAGISFACIYTSTTTAVSGAHQSASLPDGSSVKLNAESEMKYKPYLWFASRKVILKGEGYFEIKQGSRFTVKSGQNQVSVLGTSFNVFARDEKYSVTCLTGKVEVTINRENVILTPNMQATFRNGKLQIAENIDAVQSIGWTQNRFIFNGVPLTDVVKEIERQYGICIATSSNLDYFYSGNFSISNDPEEILQIIGNPFGITFSIKK